MNYMGNPRHLRARTRSSQKEYHRRQRLGTPAIPERPTLDICQGFQQSPEKSPEKTVSHVPSVTADDVDTFDAKRLRLLRQQDWLGLNISAPIKIYDIRAEKERKRRANGPFMKPLLQQPTELTTVTPPLSHIPESPSKTSHSSTSVRPEPTLPSIYSSQHGSGFIPSHHTSPVIAHRGSSTLSSATWNTFTDGKTSEIQFIPEQTPEIDFFQKPSDRDPLDMKSVWNLVEERKREDQLLRAEFGWASQSVSQMSQQQSQQPSQSQQPMHSQLELDEHEERSIYGLKGERYFQMGSAVNIPGRLSSQQRDDAPSTEDSETFQLADSIHTESNDDARPGHLHTSVAASESTDRRRPASLAKQGGYLVDTPKLIEEDDHEEDEGIPWF